MNYHVFVVDNTTFKYHLEYMFAGTGARDQSVPFLTESKYTSIHPNTEINLVGMIADISRIRIGDKIIFYLQSYNGNQGMFFGVFKAASKAFFDENDNYNYLKKTLNKALTFRIKIEPDIVYKFGVSEHFYLDSLEGIQYPYQMCWSLIYRKLKGNRGCTMITEYEYNSLLRKLAKYNNDTFNQMMYNNTAFNQMYNNTAFNQMIYNNAAFSQMYNNTASNQMIYNTVGFTFNSVNCIIEPTNNNRIYEGRIESLKIRDRMIFKYNKGNAFEAHLQAYIMQNYDVEPLQNILLPVSGSECWIGNEVSCGVGMQRIDILLQQEEKNIKNIVYLKIIELKCSEPQLDILIQQLPWYINWVIDYVVPNYLSEGKEVHIIPCIIARMTNDSQFLSTAKSFKYSINSIPAIIDDLEFIAFDIMNNDIKFKKII